MIDYNLLRRKPEEIAKKLTRRGFKLDIEKLYDLEKRRKSLQIQTENLQAKRKLQSKIISQMKDNKLNLNVHYLKANQLNNDLGKSKAELEIIRNEISNFMLNIPNIPDDSVPFGRTENDNVEIKRWGTPRSFNFKIRDHVALSKMYDGLDFSLAVKMTGSRFVVMKGQIARLHRALIQFMLDLHTNEHGYSETYVPYLVNRKALYGTGQLPKFANDLFYSYFNRSKEQNNYALIPTAEVPLINIVSNKILNVNDLPIKLTAHSPCFRSEAGSYGQNDKALIRMHQFDKVEIVQIVHPEDSMNALEEITSHAEKVLELLGLPYRRVVLCTGDMGFCSCKTYDLEVWIPTQHTYREISSCSNVWDFQARRMQTRYRIKSENKTSLVHTINGSGLAVSRTLVAILENYQQSDGKIKIPEILRPYMKYQQYIS